ncbi:MAG: hypothetical protein L6265_00480, partial [Thermoplasmatales archaeon]|nr:hypothetical protein [Thermoplasmatales archaeon]
RFMFNATPVFAILSGWIIWEIIGKVDFRTMIKNVHGMRGNKFYAMKKGVKLQHVGCALFLVFCIVLPNAMGAIDASIPYEKKGEYDRMIYDWLPDFAKPSDYSGSWYLGAHGQGFLSDYWFDGLKWLSTQDTDVPVEERPAFIAWWDYGFQCVQDGKHPTIADNFQNGIPPAGNFITAQNESKAISVLITRILSAEYTKHGKINDDVNNVLLLHLGSNDSKTLEDIIKNPDKYVDYVLENPEKCGKRTKDIADREQNTGLHSENTMYAAAMIMLGEKGEETVVNLLHDLQEVTGHSIRYFAADARMFPFSWSNTGIFYAPTVLSDQDVNDFFETLIIGEERDEDNNIVTTTVPMTAKEFIEWRDNAPPEHIRYASDYELKYKEQFYNSMFYKGYIGYS